MVGAAAVIPAMIAPAIPAVIPTTAIPETERD
jgi:hypothetical protein